MKIGQILRYSRPYDFRPSYKDGLPNYFHETYSAGHNYPLLDAGINPIQKIRSIDGERCPAILISSSPHKIGSAETPWQDFFNPDLGYIRYFGDNKKNGLDPAKAPGNKALLEQFRLHSSRSILDRSKSCPIIFFKRVSIDGRTKGNVQFHGFGIIERVELVSQFDRRNNYSFANYVFNFAVLSLKKEHELFNWQWISALRDPNLSVKDTLLSAPNSWIKWVQNGSESIESCRRRVSKLHTLSAWEQRSGENTRQLQTLNSIYSFYRNRAHRFEFLASIIAERVINGHGTHYKRGWITPASSDGGSDFIGRIDIGRGFSTAKIVVLGQAKCEKIDKPTSGNHIARTVARLKRGWIGVYVTTSFFSEAVQREVLEDKFPIILINGHTLAEETFALAHEYGFENIMSLLQKIDADYEKQIMTRDPEEILYLD